MLTFRAALPLLWMLYRDVLFYPLDPGTAVGADIVPAPVFVALLPYALLLRQLFSPHFASQVWIYPE